MTTAFAVRDGELHVASEGTGISPLVMILDGLRLVGWRGERQLYMRVADALAWHEREGRPRNAVAAAALRDAMGRFGRGELVAEHGPAEGPACCGCGKRLGPDKGKYTCPWCGQQLTDGSMCCCGKPGETITWVGPWCDACCLLKCG